MRVNEVNPPENKKLSFDSLQEGVLYKVVQSHITNNHNNKLCLKVITERGPELFLPSLVAVPGFMSVFRPNPSWQFEPANKNAMIKIEQE